MKYLLIFLLVVTSPVNAATVYDSLRPQKAQNFGWVPPNPYHGFSYIRKILVKSEKFTLTKPIGSKSGSGFDIVEVGEDELPYIDARGDTNRNYCIVLTASWCIHCKRMNKEIRTLRDAGYMVYVLDIDDYPDLKDKLNRLDPDAPKIDSGVPWVLVRDKGKTIKVFKGFTSADKIEPYLKHYKTQLKEEEEEEKESKLYDFIE